jgi:hypothetical protein
MRVEAVDGKAAFLLSHSNIDKAKRDRGQAL